MRREEVMRGIVLCGQRVSDDGGGMSRVMHTRVNPNERGSVYLSTSSRVHPNVGDRRTATIGSEAILSSTRTVYTPFKQLKQTGSTRSGVMRRTYPKVYRPVACTSEMRAFLALQNDRTVAWNRRCKRLYIDSDICLRNLRLRSLPVCENP